MPIREWFDGREHDSEVFGVGGAPARKLGAFGLSGERCAKRWLECGRNAEAGCVKRGIIGFRDVGAEAGYAGVA